MTTNLSLIMAYILAVGSVVSLAVMWVADWRERCYSRREVTRFPMFAARDGLVSLIADGLMNENDHPWKWSYKGINFILMTHQRWHLLGVVQVYIKHIARLHSDPEQRRRQREIEAQIGAAAKACPEFGKVQEQIGRAFREMVQARTNIFHVALLWVVVGVLATVAASLNLSMRIVPEVLRSFRNPAPNTLATIAT